MKYLQFKQSKAFVKKWGKTYATSFKQNLEIHYRYFYTPFLDLLEASGNLCKVAHTQNIM